MLKAQGKALNISQVILPEDLRAKEKRKWKSSTWLDASFRMVLNNTTSN